MTSADALEELRQELGQRGVVFGMARVKQDPRSELAAAGLVERIGEDRIFPTLPTAVAAYVAAYTARHGAPPEGWQSLAPGQPPRADAGSFGSGRRRGRRTTLVVRRNRPRRRPWARREGAMRSSGQRPVT